MSITDQAICLRRSDYSETSLVLGLMTREHGQVTVMAKGAKRPKSRIGPIDLLAVGQAVCIMPHEHSVSTMGTLAAWDQSGYHPRLRQSLLLHAVAAFAGEMLGKLTIELDPHPAAFDAMVGLLDSLQAGEPPLRRLADFARALLADVGLTPNLAACAACGRGVQETRGHEDAATWGEQAKPLPASPRPRVAASWSFTPSRGGVLCPACLPGPGEEVVEVSPELCRFFTLVSSATGKLALEIARWLIYYVRYQLGRPLASAEPLERAIATALANLRTGG